MPTSTSRVVDELDLQFLALLRKMANSIIEWIFHVECSGGSPRIFNSLLRSVSDHQGFVPPDNVYYQEYVARGFICENEIRLRQSVMLAILIHRQEIMDAINKRMQCLSQSA